MRYLFVLVVFSIFAPHAYGYDSPQYFPGERDLDATNNIAASERGKAHLLAYLKEPPLCCGAVVRGRVFRFIWARAFKGPVVLRLNEQASGGWLLHTKMVQNHIPQPDWGPITVNETKSLTSERVEKILALVDFGKVFWSQPVRIDRYGSDGAGWTIEAHKDGAYHYVARWSPENGYIQEIGKEFLRLSERAFGTVY